MYTGPSIITDGLILYLDAANIKSYPRNGTVWKDMSGKGHNATLENGPTIINENGGAIVFDGVNDVATLGNLSSFAFTDGVFSVSVWLKIPSTWTGGSQYPNLVSKGASAGWDTDGWSAFIFRNRGSGTGYSIGCGLRNGQTTNIREVQNLPADVSLNAVITAGGSGTFVKIYINGVSRSVGTQTINPASNSSSVVIARGPTSQWFPGRVYNVMVWNKELTAAQVFQNYNAIKSRHGL